jgi:nucleoside-diphosphate-sugar epimerase
LEESLKVLLTGHNGYIGSVMAPILLAAGHEVVGLDTYLFEECTFGPTDMDLPALRVDLRDVSVDTLRGFDAVVHLAALSNDPLGSVNAEVTYDINYRASVTLATLAKSAGVSRYVYASSCSLYGVAGDAVLAEDAAFHPVTPYAKSKVLVEQEVSRLADDSFSPTFMRNATAYGVSPRLRADVVVNNLTGFAFSTGEVLSQSDGTPWRPLVHVEDISRAFLAVLEAPRERIHNEAFNVGATSENYQIRDISEIVCAIVPGAHVRYADGAGPDPRCYRVDCGKIAALLPSFRPAWTVRLGVQQLFDAFQQHGLSQAELTTKYVRLRQINALQQRGVLDQDMRWINAGAEAVVAGRVKGAVA